jgi:hypothetical protein
MQIQLSLVKPLLNAHVWHSALGLSNDCDDNMMTSLRLCTKNTEPISAVFLSTIGALQLLERPIIIKQFSFFF